MGRSDSHAPSSALQGWSEAHATRRLILHIGLQKTGSTAVQRFLGMNAATLAPRLAVFTPRPGTPARRLGRIAADFSRRPELEEELIGAIETMRGELDMHAGTCLISHENLVGAAPGSVGETGLYPALERILVLLDRHFAPYRPEVVFFTRDVNAWKRSVHNQVVRTDGYTGTFDDFSEMAREITGFEALESRMVAVLGRSRVTRLRLEDEANPARPANRLLRVAGVPDKVLARLKPLSARVNESLNAGSLEFMRRVNIEGFNPYARFRLAKLIAQNQPLFATSVGPTQE